MSGQKKFFGSLLKSYYSLMLSSKRNLIVINGAGLDETLGIKMSRFIPPRWCWVSDKLEIGDTR